MCSQILSKCQLCNAPAFDVHGWKFLFFVSACMWSSMHVGDSANLYVPPGIKFMKAYAWITSERWPQVGNLMSPLRLCSATPTTHPEKKYSTLCFPTPFPLQSHDGQKWAICALLRDRGKFLLQMLYFWLYIHLTSWVTRILNQTHDEPLKYNTSLKYELKMKPAVQVNC